MNPIDFLGQPIRAGDTVVYPWRRGSAMGLSKMVVTQSNEDGIQGFNSLGRRIRLTNLKNVVIVSDKQG
jgi:hypothetical protein